MENQLSYWYTGQIVTAAQMNDFSRDIYLRFAQLTDQQAPCILSLNLAALTEASGNVSVPAGSFRFVDQAYYAPYSNVIFGNAPAAVLPVTGNGFIVARYTVTPITSLETNYYFPTQYLFVATVNPVTDVTVCTITAGLISSTGKFFNYFPDIVDINGLVTVTGAGGLSVTNHINSGGNVGVGGNLTVTGNTGLASGLTVGAGLSVTGATQLIAPGGRGGIIAFLSSANTAYFGSNNTSTGGYNGFTFDDTIGRPRLNNPAPAITSVNEIACINDINGALPVIQQFSVTDSGGNAWVLTCESTIGVFPTPQGIIINGFCASYTFPAGITTNAINLAAAGIIPGAASIQTHGIVALASVNIASSISFLDVFSFVGNSFINIQTTSTGFSDAIQFTIIYK